MTDDSRGHMPDGRWAFDEGVTRVFDDMLERSIPQYVEMRRLTTEFAVRYAQPGTAVIDLGCSRGEALAQVEERLRGMVGATFVGVEVSPPMVEAARSRFANVDGAAILDIDLRREFPRVRSSVVLSVLTLQFIPIEHRQRVLSAAFASLVPGGAMVVVEKILGADAHLDDLFVDEYLRMKAAHGYSAQEIERKRLALEGVLVPVTASWMEYLLHGAGFRRVDCFWRWCNFAGWLAVKESS